MARYSLAALWRRKSNPRRREVTLRPIVIPSTFASDLYAQAYAPVVKAWSDAGAPIMAEYEATLAELTRDSPEGLSVRISAVDATITSLMVSLRLRLAQWAARLESFHRRKWRGAVLSATTVDIDTLVSAGDMRAPISVAIERNASLISSVSEQTRARIGDAVFRGLQRRAPAREVAKEITDAVGMSRKRALRIAADQSVKLASALNDERRREAGIATWEWRHSGKLHPREDHKARHGRRYDDDAKSGAAKPPEDRPGYLPFCGCTSRAVLSLQGEF